MVVFQKLGMVGYWGGLGEPEILAIRLIDLA